MKTLKTVKITAATKLAAKGMKRLDNSIIGILNREMADRQYKVWAEINLGALKRNYRKIEEIIASKKSHAKLMPIIKADAYGHGAAQSIIALYEAGARIFAVSAVSEALELRRTLEDCNIHDKVDILILGYTVEEDVDLLYGYDLIQAVFSYEYAESLNEACKRKLHDGEKIRVHIKVDTGMNRIGFAAKGKNDDTDDIIKTVKLSHLSAEGIFTHYACADERESPLTEVQSLRFENIIVRLREAGIEFKMRHICNSAGIIRNNGDLYDAVRPGIILYGLPPSDEFDINMFESVMTLKTRIAHIHEISAGESVSYGAIFTADRDMKIATIPVGYADGFIRAYKDALVHVDGRLCPIVGRICMDQCMIDVTDVDVKRGDEVTLFGSAADVERYAAMSRTISYEVLCIIGKRVPRVYINN